MKHRKFNLIFFASVIFVFSFGNVVSSQIKTAAIPVPFSTLALAFDGTEKELYRSVDITLKLWLGSLDVNDPERLWAIEHNIQWLIRGEPHNLLEVELWLAQHRDFLYRQKINVIIDPTSGLSSYDLTYRHLLQIAPADFDAQFGVDAYASLRTLWEPIQIAIVTHLFGNLHSYLSEIYQPGKPALKVLEAFWKKQAPHTSPSTINESVLLAIGELQKNGLVDKQLRFATAEEACAFWGIDFKTGGFAPSGKAMQTFLQIRRDSINRVSQPGVDSHIEKFVGGLTMTVMHQRATYGETGKLRFQITNGIDSTPLINETDIPRDLTAVDQVFLSGMAVPLAPWIAGVALDATVAPFVVSALTVGTVAGDMTTHGVGWRVGVPMMNWGPFSVGPSVGEWYGFANPLYGQTPLMPGRNLQLSFGARGPYGAVVGPMLNYNTTYKTSSAGVFAGVPGVAVGGYDMLHGVAFSSVQAGPGTAWAAYDFNTGRSDWGTVVGARATYGIPQLSSQPGLKLNTQIVPATLVAKTSPIIATFAAKMQAAGRLAVVVQPKPSAPSEKITTPDGVIDRHDPGSAALWESLAAAKFKPSPVGGSRWDARSGHGTSGNGELPENFYYDPSKSFAKNQLESGWTSNNGGGTTNSGPTGTLERPVAVGPKPTVLNHAAAQNSAAQVNASIQVAVPILPIVLNSPNGSAEPFDDLFKRTDPEIQAALGSTRQWLIYGQPASLEDLFTHLGLQGASLKKRAVGLYRLILNTIVNDLLGELALHQIYLKGESLQKYRELLQSLHNERTAGEGVLQTATDRTKSLIKDLRLQILIFRHPILEDEGFLAWLKKLALLPSDLIVWDETVLEFDSADDDMLNALEDLRLACGLGKYVVAKTRIFRPTEGQLPLVVVAGSNLMPVLTLGHELGHVLQFSASYSATGSYSEPQVRIGNKNLFNILAELEVHLAIITTLAIDGQQTDRDISERLQTLAVLQRTYLPLLKLVLQEPDLINKIKAAVDDESSQTYWLSLVDLPWLTEVVAALEKLEATIALLQEFNERALGEINTLVLSPDLAELLYKPGSDESVLSQRSRTIWQRSSNQSTAAETGRNDPCHCGSGKKFKRCHGKL